MRSVRVIVVLLAGLLMTLESFAIDSSNALDHWQWRYPLPVGTDLSGAAFGGGLYVIVGKDGTILSSVDMESWTVSQDKFRGHFVDVQYGGGQFVAIGEAFTNTYFQLRSFYSTDGKTWQNSTIGTNTVTGSISSIAYGNG